MPEGYLHLTCEQRCQIYALLQSGHSQTASRGKLAWDSVDDEPRACSQHGARGYRFKQARKKASQNAKRPRTSRAK